MRIADYSVTKGRSLGLKYSSYDGVKTALA